MSATPTPRRLGVLLFPGFEVLDVFGPVEVFGVLKDLCEVVLVAAEAGPVASAQGVAATAAHGFADCPPLDLVLVPGGIGTRRGVDDEVQRAWLVERAAAAEIVMSVCTGAALLARAGLLDGRPATTNKRAFAWVESQGPATRWVREARWVDDGDRVSSSGVTAGIDMSLAVVERLWGAEIARSVAEAIEYERHADPTWDPFARIHGLI
jgi:transcriptional regulator GlxA family with amidase domain